jgi:hypothetical protein
MFSVGGVQLIVTVPALEAGGVLLDVLPDDVELSGGTELSVGVELCAVAAALGDATPLPPPQAESASPSVAMTQK